MQKCDYCNEPKEELAGTPYLADSGKYKMMCKDCWDITPTELEFRPYKRNT